MHAPQHAAYGGYHKKLIMMSNAFTELPDASFAMPKQQELCSWSEAMAMAMAMPPFGRAWSGCKGHVPSGVTLFARCVGLQS